MSETNKTNLNAVDSQANRTIPDEDPRSVLDAMAEVMQLYHSWLGYLLNRMGTDTLRVKTEDISRGLALLRCSVTREGDEYVIRLENGREGGDACDHA